MLSLAVRGERSSLSLSTHPVMRLTSLPHAVAKAMTTEAKAERDVSSYSPSYEFHIVTCTNNLNLKLFRDRI